MINMYIAIILENYDQAHEQEEIGITEDDFEDFYRVWENYDPYATQFIKLEDLSDLINDLRAPFGVKKPNDMAITAFNLPIIKGDLVHCLDVLHSLAFYTLGNIEYTDNFKVVQEKIEKQFSAHFPLRVSYVPISTTFERKKFEIAARTLQKAWRRFKLKKIVLNKMKERRMSQNRSPSYSTDSLNSSYNRHK